MESNFERTLADEKTSLHLSESAVLKESHANPRESLLQEALDWSSNHIPELAVGAALTALGGYEVSTNNVTKLGNLCIELLRGDAAAAAISHSGSALQDEAFDALVKDAAGRGINVERASGRIFLRGGSADLADFLKDRLTSSASLEARLGDLTVGRSFRFAPLESRGGISVDTSSTRLSTGFSAEFPYPQYPVGADGKPLEILNLDPKY